MAAAAEAGRAWLPASKGTLLDAYDLLLVDLDGVVYLGDRPVEGAADALAAARATGSEVVFVTNNASRTPAAVAEHLSAMGAAATAEEVMTSAVAAAGVLAGELPPDAAVLVVGGAGIRAALTDVGLRPVDAAGDDPVAVLQGFAPEVDWHSLAEAAVAIRAGARWTATNADVTLPSPRGPLPGNGALVAALVAATGQQPRVIGKPERALVDAALAAHPGHTPLVIGDRLDTDIAGAHAAGLPSLLVLTGVSQARDLLRAPQDARPQYVGRDMSALQAEHPAAAMIDGAATSGGAIASIDSGGVRLARASAPASPDGLDELRALIALAWSSEQNSSSSMEMYEKVLKSLDLD